MSVCRPLLFLSPYFENGGAKIEKRERGKKKRKRKKREPILPPFSSREGTKRGKKKRKGKKGRKKDLSPRLFFSYP